jgi:hypothetical protein
VGLEQHSFQHCDHHLRKTDGEWEQLNLRVGGELYGRSVTPLKSCKVGHSLEALQLYYHLKALRGERIEEATHANLGVITCFSLVTWGNFEHIQ